MIASNYRIGKVADFLEKANTVIYTEFKGEFYDPDLKGSSLARVYNIALETQRGVLCFEYWDPDMNDELDLYDVLASVQTEKPDVPDGMECDRMLYSAMIGWKKLLRAFNYDEIALLRTFKNGREGNGNI